MSLCVGLCVLGGGVVTGLAAAAAARHYEK